MAAVMLQDMGSDFELLSELTAIEIIAVNLSIRERRQLRDQIGGRRWRKLKGVCRVRFPNGAVRLAEVHGDVPTVLLYESRPDNIPVLTHQEPERR